MYTLYNIYKVISIGDPTPCLVPTPDGEFTRDTEREINLHVLRPLTELRSVARGGVFLYAFYIKIRFFKNPDFFGIRILIFKKTPLIYKKTTLTDIK